MNDVMYLKYHTLLYRSASLIEGATEMAHLYINNNVIWNQGAQMIYKTHYNIFSNKQFTQPESKLVYKAVECPGLFHLLTVTQTPSLPPKTLESDHGRICSRRTSSPAWGGYHAS